MCVSFAFRNGRASQPAGAGYKQMSMTSQEIGLKKLAQSRLMVMVKVILTAQLKYHKPTKIGVGTYWREGGRKKHKELNVMPNVKHQNSKVLSHQQQSTRC